MGTDGGSDAAVDALATVVNALASPGIRRKFAHDPDATLQELGVNVSALPSGVQALLHDLSYEELRLISRLQTTLVGEGMLVTGSTDAHTLAKL
jgi:hypothetical protein